jgi:hypothetical protein
VRAGVLEDEPAIPDVVRQVLPSPATKDRRVAAGLYESPRWQEASPAAERHPSRGSGCVGEILQMVVCAGLLCRGRTLERPVCGGLPDCGEYGGPVWSFSAELTNSRMRA